MITFARAVREALPHGLDGLPLSSISLLDYKDELEVKRNAFQAFCEQNGLPPFESDVVASPLPRGYRTTTKRRASFERGVFKLSFAEDTEENTAFSESLEPAEHLAIYDFVENFLSKPAFKILAESLNWVILRGSYKKRSVIFNVFQMDAGVVRKLKLISAHLQASEFAVISAHVYYDPTHSDYYLEAMRPTDSLAFKTLYGPKDLSLDLGAFRLKYPVTGFSQINESQIPNFLSSAAELLKPAPDEALLDLYCGYGLFSFGIGANAKSTLGIEWEGLSIEYAKASAKFLKRMNARFLAGSINSEFVEHSIPKEFAPEVMLLDPPRKGTEPGVIAALAKRNPRRVLHVFCGTDEIPRAMNQWRLAHYKIMQMRVLDLFPGTPHLETMVLLEKA
ncbi:MAG: class I SAM-dependent RNA methyltransferase [Fibrobacteraceae bacterium]|nr:class I SAM-dependent RNA methyltransferase [Fibrobacteraceae bacterium]